MSVRLTTSWSPPVMPNPSAPVAVSALVAQLGTQTHLSLEGAPIFNEPLVQAIAAHREQALPWLNQFFNGVTHIPALLEGLQVVNRLAQNGVRGVEALYPAIRRWNGHPDPAVQMQLARLYGVLKHPGSFGPMLSTLVHQAVTQYPMQSSPTFNVTEAAGETVLKQLAERTAEETVQRLLPYLRRP